MANEELASRLKTFALMLKFGHDLFEAGDYNSAAIQAVNDSVVLLNFKSAALFEMQGGKALAVGQSGQTAVNPNSKHLLLQKKLAEALTFEQSALTVTAETGLVPELFQEKSAFFCLKLSLPSAERTGLSFLWLLEYENEIPAAVPNTAKLLGSSITEALYYHKFLPGNSLNKRKIRTKTLWCAVILLLLTARMFVPVPENITADFVLKAPEITAAYAPFDGAVRHCRKQSGTAVKKGDLIAEFDTEQLNYRLHMAQAAVKEAETELYLEQQNAFTDQEKLGKVKLLEARRAALLVAVREAQWYLNNSQIKAPADGVLILNDEKAELLEGKVLRTGEKIFEIHGGRGMIAEIHVNEENSSMLQKNFSTALFLHTAPDKKLLAKVLQISSYPELTEQRIYCYKVSAELERQNEILRYGMRGIAKLSGEKVSLGYAVAKRIILWFRSI